MSKENILILFFVNHLKVKEIAEIEHISSAYVTKTVKHDPRYTKEKEYRKNISKEKRKNRTEYIYKKQTRKAKT